MISTPIPVSSKPHLILCKTHELLHSKNHHRSLRLVIRSSSSPVEDFLPPIKVAKRVVLVRHGQSTWNAEGRIQGSSDFSILTQKGEAQAQTSRQMLIHESFDVCFSSPLMRSKRTAEIIWDARKDEIITDADLREIDLYSFQGLLKHEGIARYGSAYQQWQVDAANFNIDGHYPVRELWAQARNCWPKILNHDSKSVLVVAHNAVNQALIASAIGLGTEYFRTLLQSNCGVSVLDFTPHPEPGSLNISLNRLNQTPNSPVSTGTSVGRKASMQIILVCHGIPQGETEDYIPDPGDGPMNMLGVIQAQKTAELLLDLKLKAVISSTVIASTETANAICRVQEAADVLGADRTPRYVEMKQTGDLDIGHILKNLKKGAQMVRPFQPGWLNGFNKEVAKSLWNQSGKAWRYLLNELCVGSKEENVVVAVGHPAVHVAMLGHCLNLTEEWMGTFHLDAGSISVVDFPDGPDGKGTVRCINYTAHLGRWSIPISRSKTSYDDKF